MGNVVMPITENFDYKIHICFVDAILQHYLKNVNNVFEFGCGPAYHLIRLKEFNKDLKAFNQQKEIIFACQDKNYKVLGKYKDHASQFIFQD